jgi:hypothetical protein
VGGITHNGYESGGGFLYDVVGWTVAPFDGSSEPYDMWMRAKDEAVGGAMRIPHGMNFPPHWTFYIAVPNLDGAVSQIERLGGKALSELIEVPNVGRMRAMTDPQGAMFSIIEPAPSSSNRPETKPALGEVSWYELYTSDAESAKKFYQDVFGWRETETMDMGPMGKCYMFGRQWSMGGMMNKPKEMAQAPNHWLLYFNVPDVHAASVKIKAKGGQVLNTMEVPGGDWIAQCIDPQGAAFAVHHFKKS